MPEPWIFDLDGTLADSSEGILESLEVALKACGYPMRVSDPRLLIGPNLPVSVSIANPDLAPGEVRQVVTAYREYYNATGHKKSSLYPGVPQTLQFLADSGRPLYILTNKIQLAADIISVHLGLKKWVTAIFGQDAAERPKPERMLAMVRELGLSRGVLVGDGLDDFAAAQGAGYRFLLARWGYGAQRVQEKHGPVQGFDRVEEMCQLICDGKTFQQ
mgnify:CR=1 FL=1